MRELNYSFSLEDISNPVHEANLYKLIGLSFLAEKDDALDDFERRIAEATRAGLEDFLKGQQISSTSEFSAD
jgi:hypothetical protein